MAPADAAADAAASAGSAATAVDAVAAEATAGGPAQLDGAPLTLSVTLVYAAGPHQLLTLPLLLPAAATAGDAVRASGLPERLGNEVMRHLRLAVWGRLCGPSAQLQPGDRLSLLRGLVVDPMEARRRRLQRDGQPKPQRRTPRRG